MAKYLREILIVLLVIWIASKYIGSPDRTVHTTTNTVTDTIPVTIYSDPVIHWDTVKVKDDSTVNELNNLIDSLKAEMNKVIDSTGYIGEYVAVQDTTVKDTSGNDVAKVMIRAISRIPLDPKLKMQSDITLYQKTTTITNTIHETTFWQRFGISAQAGIGYGWFGKQFDVYTGVGFHFAIN